MTRRRLHKRSRRKAKFHKVQEILRKDVRSKVSDSRNAEYKEKSDLSHSRSPESVLFESQHADPLCGDKLSPEIVPKQLRPRSESDSKIDDEIAVRMIQQSSPISHKVLPSDFKHGTKCINDFSNSEDSREPELNTTKSIVDDPFDLTGSCSFNLSSSLSNEPNNNANGRSSLKSVDARRNLSGSNLEPQSRDDGTLANSDEKGSLGMKSTQDRYILETLDDYYLDKTLSMNDNLVREINSYLDRQSPVVAGKSARDRVSHFVILRDERGEIIGSGRDNLDKKKRGPSSGSKRFDVALERIGEHLATNWREFRKIFAHLRRANRRTRDEDDAADRSESLLHRYRRFPYISVSTLSLPASIICTPSPRRVNHEARESAGTKRETEASRISSGSTTPRIGVKSCRRTTLTFGDEDEGEAARHRQPASRAGITDPFPEGRKKDKGRPFPLDPPWLSDKSQNNRVLQSTISDIELSERDGHSGSPQKVYL